MKLKSLAAKLFKLFNRDWAPFITLNQGNRSWRIKEQWSIQEILQEAKVVVHFYSVEQFLNIQPSLQNVYLNLDYISLGFFEMATKG